MPSDFKKPPRYKATPEEWVKLREEKLGPCRVCGKPNGRGLSVYPARHWNESGLESTLHHILSKSLGGDDTADNLAPVCGSGTTGCHGLIEAHDRAACAVFGRSLTGRERGYVLVKKNADFLARRYGQVAA